LCGTYVCTQHTHTHTHTYICVDTQFSAKSEKGAGTSSLSSVYHGHSGGFPSIRHVFLDILEIAESENHRGCRSGWGSTNGNVELFNRT